MFSVGFLNVYKIEIFFVIDISTVHINGAVIALIIFISNNFITL